MYFVLLSILLPKVHFLIRVRKMTAILHLYLTLTCISQIEMQIEISCYVCCTSIEINDSIMDHSFTNLTTLFLLKY